MNIFKHLVYFLTSIIFVFNLSLPAYSSVNFANGVKKGQKKIIKNDLLLLAQSNFSAADPETLRLMDIPNFYAESLETWLYDRVQYVIGEVSWVKSLFKLKYLEQDYRYENPDIFPDLELPQNLPPMPAPIRPNAKEEENEPMAVMANFGAAIYHFGKEHKVLMGMKMGGIGPFGGKTVAVTSPRTGIIMIGDGHFHPAFNPNPDDVEAEVNALGRLATMFHEARHSDGNGKSLTFGHALCPGGHDFFNYNACDRNLNGPYTIGARVMLEFIKNCKSCTELEKDKVLIRIMDSYSRVLHETVLYKPTNKDHLTIRQGIISTFYNNHLKRSPYEETIRGNMPTFNPGASGFDGMILMPGEAIIIPSTEWDARPEGRRE